MEKLPEFDYLSSEKISPSSIDLVLISHFHLDHAAGLPYFTEKLSDENGKFEGKVFATHPTKAIMRLMLESYVRTNDRRIRREQQLGLTKTKLQNIFGGFADFSDTKNEVGLEEAYEEDDILYSEEDLKRCLNKIEVVDFKQEVEYKGIKFCCYNAGHVLGAAMFMIEIDGVNILYTGDYSRTEDRHLMAADDQFSVSPDILIVESTFGDHKHRDREEREEDFGQLLNLL